MSGVLVTGAVANFELIGFFTVCLVIATPRQIHGITLGNLAEFVSEAVPFRYPEREVSIVTVEKAPAASPVTVSGSAVPRPTPAATVPALALGVHAQFESQLVTLNVNPFLVLIAGEKVGVNGAESACPITVPVPEAYPVREVPTVIVAKAPLVRPVTLKGNVAPDGAPAVTAPLLTVGVDQVNAES